MQKSEAAAGETNRATVVALMAEVRRIKARLMDDLPKLQKLAHKKVASLLFFDNTPSEVARGLKKSRRIWIFIKEN